MEDLIQNEIQNVRRDIIQLNSHSDEYLFSLVCYKYFYNDGFLDYKDYKKVFTDGKNDGGIDLISVKDDTSDQTYILLIQSKYIDSLANSQDIVDIFTKIDQTVKDFIEDRTTKYNDKLKRIFKNAIADTEDLSITYNYILFIGTDLSENVKTDIDNRLDNIKEFEGIEVSIYSKNEIESQIVSIKEPKKFVAQANIGYAKDHGLIKYGERGILVNISAKSLKSLYDRFKNEGLFEQNFRYFIRNKKIDDSIKTSLSSKRNEFWFLNNGIIIGCTEFVPDGNKIRIYNFSIINGCQTTTLIGEYKGANQGDDFYIPCKIITSGDEKVNDHFEKFISEVAESSNSQKPISERDLKSNRPELRLLKKMLFSAEPIVNLIIKRGEEIKRKNLEPWQIINNDYLGQLILSFNLQKPGTARSAKKKIFGDEITYSKIFKRTHSKENIVDLLKLSYTYDRFLNKRIDDFTDSDHSSIATNGKLIMIALVGFILKEIKKLIGPEAGKNNDRYERELELDNLSGNIFVDKLPDNFEDIIHQLFFEVSYEIYLLYQTRKNEKKTVSNFFKLDSEYIQMTKHIRAKFISVPEFKKMQNKIYFDLFISNSK